MFTHTIVFVVLSILSTIAVYAAGTPVSKLPMVLDEPETDDTHGTDPGEPASL
jgi:hypothetical protein